MALATEVECTNSVFTCPASECEGVMEASATGWLNLERGANGAPVLSIFGFSEGDYKVACSECGESGDDSLNRAVGQVIYGKGTRDWFRG